MNLSAKQQQALQKIRDWYKNPNGPQVFKLMGYAGTGKTTIAKEVKQFVNGPVVFAAFTGKAASVLQAKGCHGAQTIHSLIYMVKEKSRSGIIELEALLQQLEERLEGLDKEPIAADKKSALKSRLESDKQDLQRRIEIETSNLSRPRFVLNPDGNMKHASLVVLDEVSMVNQEMGEDLLSFGKKILVMGDPAQLPPVFGAGYFLQGKPDVLLTEIHRQAEGNPILSLATRARAGIELIPGQYGESYVLDKGSKLPDDVLTYQQILVGRNDTRKRINNRIREIRGYQAWHPVSGDRLICLKNNADIGLLNGTIWTVLNTAYVEGPRIGLEIQSEEGTKLITECHSAPFQGKEIPFWDKKEAQEFDYGYAVTVHKAQGSQWDSVLLYDESFCFREHRNKWLYTGITRAASRVTILKT